MIYLLQHIAGLDNLTPAELVARAKCLCGIPENRLKAVEVALLCAATGGVPPCPPSGGGAGCTYQDMQVAWTPTNLKLGEMIGFYSFNNMPGLQTLTFNQATSINGVDIELNDDLTSISFPNLINASNGISIEYNPILTVIDLPKLVDLGGNTLYIDHNVSLVSVSFPVLVTVQHIIATNSSALTNVSLPSWLPSPSAVTSINFNGCNLSAASVDHILSRGVANPAYITGGLDLSGGTNSPPTSTAPGSDYAILVARGVNVMVNP